MPLDNAKLERAVNTTEKLVRRMGALEARRADAPEVPSGWKIVKVPAGGWEVTAPDGKSYRSKTALGVKEIIQEHGGRKDAKQIGPGAFKLRNERRREELAKSRGQDYKVYTVYKNGNSKPSDEWFTEEEAEKKKKYWEGLNPNSKFEVRKARSDSRKDDYGHPVKSSGNHVQQMDYGRGDEEKSHSTEQEGYKAKSEGKRYRELGKSKDTNPYSGDKSDRGRYLRKMWGDGWDSGENVEASGQRYR